MRVISTSCGNYSILPLKRPKCEAELHPSWPKKKNSGEPALDTILPTPSQMATSIIDTVLSIVLGSYYNESFVKGIGTEALLTVVLPSLG